MNRCNEAPNRRARSRVLPFTTPHAWPRLLAFLRPRAIPGVETISADTYSRTVLLEDRAIRIEVRWEPGEGASKLSARGARESDMRFLESRTRRLFDLDRNPRAIGGALSADRLLGPLVRSIPGLRVPGAWNGFELAIRAILGQQVTVRGATTLCGRLVEDYGRKNENGFYFPTSEILARARFTRIGIPRARAEALRALAGACSSGEINLEGDADPTETVAALLRLRGIGAWTAQYLAMRALGDRNAFPSTDLGLLRAAGFLLARDRNAPAARPAELRRMAESWRPWRAYAAMYLWNSLDSGQASAK